VKIGPGTAKIWWTEKKINKKNKKKITRPKYNSLSLSLSRSRATVTSSLRRFYGIGGGAPDI